MQFLLLLILSLPIWAHQTSLSAGGKELYWVNKNVPLMIRNSSSDLSAADAQTIIRNSMAQWNGASSAQLNHVTSSINEVKFVSNFPYGSAVLGVTELSYNKAGAIQKAVILLNDDYYFHNTPGLYPPGQVYLGDVVTHEMGHLFGLSHSEVLNSSMFYSSFSGQSSVAFDDKSGVRQKYDTTFGKIIGVVQGGSSVGVLGAHVQAISRRTGEASSAITDENGNFVLGGLDLNDTYYLYTAPTKNPNSLPGKYSNIQSEFCPASYVGSFFSACGTSFDGKPQGINLTASRPHVDVGVVSISCSLKSDQDYAYQKIQTNFAPVIAYDYSSDLRSEKAFVGWFRKKTNTNWSSPDLLSVDLSGYNPNGTNKYVKISLVSFPFGTQLEYQMDIERNGSLVTSGGISYSASTGTYQPDIHTFLQLDPDPNQNVFQVGVSSKKLESYYLVQTFPSVSDFTSNTHMPYLLLTSLWQNVNGTMIPIMDTASNLSDNLSCLDAPLTYSVAAAKSLSDEDTTAGTAGAACGTIDPPSSGPGASLPLIALGFLFAIMPSLLTKSSKKFLS